MRRPDAAPERYARPIKAVEGYIHAHLDHPIDLNRLAEVAGFSPYHWHRIYHAVQGETVDAAVALPRPSRTV